MPGDDMNDRLAARQTELAAAIACGAAVPPGFDPVRVGLARQALLHKRADFAARYWPLLATGLGRRWHEVFTAWAATRPGNGPLRDGWDLARSLHAAGDLPALGARELAGREAGARYDGRRPPVRRRLPTVRRVDGAIAVQARGQIRVTYRRR